MRELSDQEFHAWLNAVERGGELPATLPVDDAADLAWARRLLTLRAVPQPRLAARVQGVMLPPSSLPRQWLAMPGWQRAGAGVTAALILALTLAFTPAGTWAQGMLQRFGVIFLPGAVPQWSGGLPEITPTKSPVAFSSEGEVQAAAEFPLRWPTDFPFDRNRVTFLGYMVHSEDGIWIESLYGDTQQRRLEIQVFWQLRPGPWPVGDARFKPVRVSSHEGLWGEGVPASFIAGARSSLTLQDADGTMTRVGSSETSSLGPINILLWEDGEVLYILVDPNQQFSQADLLRTAESAYLDH
jgi:hypothetical protein